ncbi:RHS repeat domain-containing protein [Microbulbifer sp. SSSA002]|uniref:RHS repeat domain-containing protein n=1 Tax=Microbulbifer sp. SSSA002 TaxID=3243376 RepID=UPI00403A452A
MRLNKTSGPVSDPTQNTNSILERGYQYNKAGQIAKTEDSLRGMRSYHYDALDRLTQVDGPNPEYFVHDPAHNILAAANSKDEAKQQASATQIKGNRLAFRGDTHYRYDIHGNHIAELRGKGQKLQTRYHYNARQQLVRVEKLKLEEGVEQLQQEVHYQYDPLGRRIGKATNSEQTSFLWDGGVLLRENKFDIRTQQNLNTRTYYFEPGTFKPVALKEGKQEKDQVYHYHLDHLGTPDTLTNQEGEVVWSVVYKSYGNIALAHEHRIEQPIRFQGQYFDEETGLHYNRFRYYDPQVGEFTQQDPIGLLGGANNYRYVPNPVTWIDPYGLTSKDCPPVNSWNEFQRNTKGYFANSSEAAKSYQKMKEVAAMGSRTEKLKRPDPSTYLPQSYINAHLDSFQNEGAGFIAVQGWMENPEFTSLPPRKFVGLRSEMDAVIEKYESSGRDWTVLRDELSLGNVDLSDEKIVYVVVEPGDTRFDYDIADGREDGAYEGEWIPGGKTKGGTSEAALIGAENIVHDNSVDELMNHFSNSKRIR